MDRDRLLLWSVLVITALSALLGAAIVTNQRQDSEPIAVVQAVQRPVTVTMFATDVITADAQTDAVRSGYYREAVGYLYATVNTGQVTFTWQSSPDQETWFTQYAAAVVAATGAYTFPMTYFGPAVRVSYDAGPSANVTTTIWVSLKE